MTARDVIQAVHAQRLTIALHGPEHIRITPPEALPQALRQVIREHKAELLVLLRTLENAATPLVAESPPTVPSVASLPDGLTHYRSALLDCELWVAETPADAAAAPAGVVVYLMSEVWLLQDLKARDPEGFEAKLQAIHQTKQDFGGILDVLAQTADPIATPIFQTLPDVCYACGTTRRWRSVYGAVVCARCHPPVDAALVAAWEGEA